MNNAHEFVAIFEVDGDDARTKRRVILGELGFLDLTILGAEEEELVRFVISRVDDRLDFLVRLQRKKVDHRGAARGAFLHWDFVRLEAIHATAS